jgi:hypothetical protein
MSINSLWKSKPKFRKLPTLSNLSPKQKKLYQSISSNEHFMNTPEPLYNPVKNHKSSKKAFSELEYYWCNNGGKHCKRFPMDKFKPENNTCGPLSITQQPALIYYNREECENNNNECEHLEKDDCLRQAFCGWCVNGKGKGQCVKGTPEGPLNIIKYPFCVPQFTQYSTAKQNKKYRNVQANHYIAGYADPYIHDKINEDNIYHQHLF